MTKNSLRVRASVLSSPGASAGLALMPSDGLVYHAARLAPVGLGVAGDDLLVGAPHDLQLLVVFVPEQPVEQGALPVGEGGVGLEQDSAGPVQRVLLRAAPAGGLLLEALAALGELVAGEPDDVERVEDLPGVGHGLPDGVLVSGERVHRHDPHVPSELLGAGGEPSGERRAAPALDHVQETGRPPVPPGRQVHDHGHVSGATGRVPPHVLVHAQVGDPVQAVFVAGQMLHALGRDRVVRAIPQTPQRRRHTAHAHRVQHHGGDRPPRGPFRQPPPVRGHARQVVLPRAAAPAAFVTPAADQQPDPGLAQRHVDEAAPTRAAHRRRHPAIPADPRRLHGLIADLPHAAPAALRQVTLCHAPQSQRIQPQQRIPVEPAKLAYRP